MFGRKLLSSIPEFYKIDRVSICHQTHLRFQTGGYRVENACDLFQFIQLDLIFTGSFFSEHSLAETIYTIGSEELLGEQRGACVSNVERWRR